MRLRNIFTQLTFNLFTFSEKGILPCVVTVFVIVYIVVSITFYMEELQPPAHICSEET